MATTKYLGEYLEQNKIQTPAVITSQPARDLTNDNVSYLSNVESGLTSSAGVSTTPSALNVPTSATNPAQNAIVSDINQTIASMTPEQRQTALSGAISELLGRINQSGGTELSLTSQAREAEQMGDYSALNDATKALKESQEQRIKDLQELQTQMTSLRTQYLQSLTPTAEEAGLATSIADFQEQMKQYDIETQKLVYGLEGQGRGIVSGLVAGQQAKLQQQRNLEYQSMAAKEANLLSRLGLLQDARKAQQSALTTGLSILEKDYELTDRIRTEIDKENQDVLSAAAGLTKEKKDTLTFILKQFEGLDYDSLPEQSKASIRDLAEASGIDLGIIIGGLKAVKDQNDFDNMIKASQEARLTESATKKDTDDQSKEVENFRKDIADLIEKLDKGDVSWGTAFDKIKAKYPQASNELIDQMLGGGYDAEKDEWYGRAK